MVRKCQPQAMYNVEAIAMELSPRHQLPRRRDVILRFFTRSSHFFDVALIPGFNVIKFPSRRPSPTPQHYQHLGLHQLLLKESKHCETSKPRLISPKDGSSGLGRILQQIHLCTCADFLSLVPLFREPDHLQLLQDLMQESYNFPKRL